MDRFATSVSSKINCNLEVIISKLTARVAEVKKGIQKYADETDKLKNKLDGQSYSLEQYSRQNNFCITGVLEVLNEDTDSLDLQLCEDKLNIHLTLNDVNRVLRIGKIGTKHNIQDSVPCFAFAIFKYLM